MICFYFRAAAELSAKSLFAANHIAMPKEIQSNSFLD